MITDENIKALIKLNKSTKVITTKQLNELGLNSYDLKQLVANNFLERIKRGEYILKKDNKIDYSELIPLLKDKNYEAAKKVIERKKQLTKSEKVLYHLIDIALRINSNEIFSKRKINVKTISEAIETNNFEAALKIAEKHIEYYKTVKDNNAMYIVLKDIVTVTKKTSTKTTLKNVYELLTTETVKSNTFKETLTKYLEDTKNEKYEGLIYALIEIELLKNSSNFSNIINLLETIKNNNFSLKRSYYMKKFNEEIKINQFDRAEKYLNVVGCLEDIKEEHNIYKYMKQEFNTLKGINETPPNTIHIYDRELLFLNKVTTKIKRRKGITLLSPMVEEKRLRIHEVIKSFPNITSKTIGINDDKRIMLSYVVKQKYLGQTIYNAAREAYEKNENALAISIYKKIIELGGFEHFIYGNIALIYLRGKRIEPAINYFTAAYYAALEQKADANEYLQILETLKQNRDIEDIKPYIKIDEEEFSNQNINTCEIRNLSDILYLIYEEKYSIEDACNHFNLTEEEINIVKL